jgi:aspartate racemase
LRTVTATLDFNLLVANLQAGQIEAAEEQVAAVAQTLQTAGCDFIVITSGTTSTLTKLARQRVSIPFLDLAVACFKAPRPDGPIGLLSTSYAAAGGLFQAAAARRGATLIVPPPATTKRVDNAIFSELVRGEPSDACVQIFRNTIDELSASGATSVILGNTDLTLVADDLQKTVAVPLIDSTRVPL